MKIIADLFSYDIYTNVKSTQLFIFSTPPVTLVIMDMIICMLGKENHSDTI